VTAQSGDLVILACTALIGLKGVTDGRTPRRFLRRAKHYMLSGIKRQK